MFAPAVLVSPSMLLSRKEKKNDLDDIYILPRSPASSCKIEFDKLTEKLDRHIPNLARLSRQNAIDSARIADLIAREPLGLASPKIRDLLSDISNRQRDLVDGAQENIGLIDEFLKKCGHSVGVNDRFVLMGKIMTLNGLLEIRPEVAGVLRKVQARRDVDAGIMNLINGILAPWPASSQPGRFAPPVKIFE